MPVRQSDDALEALYLVARDAWTQCAVLSTCEGKCISFLWKMYTFLWNSWINQNWYITHRFYVRGHVSHLRPCRFAYIQRNIATMFQIPDMRSRNTYAFNGLRLCTQSVRKHKLNQESWWRTNLAIWRWIFYGYSMNLPFLKGKVKLKSIPARYSHPH